MINIYPANRLENLVILLDKVMHTGSHAHILSEEFILVQNKGMQHWLNLKLAESRGISMNLTFSLPMQFFWQQIRNILNTGLDPKDEHLIVPEQSSYTREILSWRIYEILSTDTIINNPLCHEASRYWLGETAAGDDADDGKRYQLSCQLADLFEQYLIFRPDWILAWDKGQMIAGLAGQQWQLLIWQELIRQEPLHPVRLLKSAVIRLQQEKCTVPERISLFGINTLPPLWLEFLSELGQQTQVHFFHLNPCVEYWGDLKTDKSYAKEQFYRWINSSDRMLSNEDIAADVPLSNPLLSNLGSQGKDFLYLLQEYTSIEIPVYESPVELSPAGTGTASVLQRVQNDILNFEDAREMPRQCIDDSIVFASAHSALREIQALHDWLLHQINNDASLTPKDILVMCPNIENYAPYVDAVFAHGWNDWSEQVPPLPCSIADRTLKDSEPLVQAFIDLLELPDSRFQVSQILGYLRLPALQKKFSFADDELVLLERWVNHAAIHWGLDAAHKQRIISTEKSISYADEPQHESPQPNENSRSHFAKHTSINNKFSWQQGLKRLLLGFAHNDQAVLYQDQLLLADVEGDEALLLGRYFELLEQLQYYARELQTARSPNDWKQFLLQARDSLFSPLSDDSNAQQIIEQAIDDFAEYTHHAHYEKKLPLSVMRDFLLSHFSQAEPGRQFMAGQVTFCSMLPMRSVPFRVIAILGLNDGEFPRQRQAMGFDLMAMQPPRKGDRSRRGDDRYLFLEALISCRDKLYLSYQGHDIKTNNSREPSLVLQELINYLEKAYGWHLAAQPTADKAIEHREQQLINIPLQVFSQANYQGKWKSFNANWLKLGEAGSFRNNLHRIDFPSADEDEITITAEQLVQFFDNPCKQFAQQRLGLYFENNQDSIPQDSEPFVTNHLDRYLIQDAIIKTLLSDAADEQDRVDLMRGFSLSGNLPDTPDMADDLILWQEQAGDFAHTIQTLMQCGTQKQDVNPIQTQTVIVTIDNVQLQAELPVLNYKQENKQDNNLLYWRLASPKGKDDMRLWIHHLMAQIAFQTRAETGAETGAGACTTRGVFRGAKEHSILTVRFDPLDSAYEHLSALLQCWKEGMRQPLLLNAALGQKHCYIKKDAKKQSSAKPLTDYTFSKFWHDDFQTQGLGSDPYIHWFWGDGLEIPQWEKNWQARIEEIYAPLYASRQENTHND